MTKYILAMTSGGYYHAKFDAREDVEVYAVNMEPDAIQAVRQGLADVYVEDEVVMSAGALKRLGLKLAFRGEDCFDIAFAITKRATTNSDANSTRT